jgi:DNA-binding transcriptional MerR regulator
VSRFRSPESRELHSIGDLAEACGISVDTLRIWERRYGRPEPIRLPSGHRRYTIEHIRWLRRVAEALAQGHRTNKVVRATDEELDRLLAKEAPPPAPEDLEPLFRAVHGYREAQLLDRLWERWRRLGPEPFLDRVLDPLLVGVGRRWADGTLDVRHEHFLSEVVEHFLRAARASVLKTSSGPGIVLATLEGELHGLGLHMAAVVCARQRWRPRVLGVSTPLDEIVKAALESKARAVGVSVSLHTGGIGTDRRLAELRRRLPSDRRVIVGGAGARGARRGPRGIEYARTLGDLARLLGAA